MSKKKNLDDMASKKSLNQSIEFIYTDDINYDL